MDQDVQVQQTQSVQGVVGGLPVVETTKTKVSFVRAVFSDGGEPSSSRILTFILSLTSLGIVIGMVHHACVVKDASTLQLWLTAIPSIIMTLIGFSAAPYAINRSTGSVSDLIGSMKRNN